MLSDKIRTDVERLISTVVEKCGTDERGAVRDIMTELMHIADKKGWEFSDIFNGAEEVFREEQGDDDGTTEAKDRRRGLYEPEYRGEQF